MEIYHAIKYLSKMMIKSCFDEEFQRTLVFINNFFEKNIDFYIENVETIYELIYNSMYIGLHIVPEVEICYCTAVKIIIDTDTIEDKNKLKLILNKKIETMECHIDEIIINSKVKYNVKKLSDILQIYKESYDSLT